MRILLCGGTGFIGTALTKALLARGDEVWIVTRRRTEDAAARRISVHAEGGEAAGPAPRYVTWDEWERTPGRFDGFDAVVNLAGESINQRWTAAAKRRIVDSRVEAAGRIAAIFRRMAVPPPVVVNASGISLYGHSETSRAARAGRQAGIAAGSPPAPAEEVSFHEDSPASPADFLGDTVIAWEAAADGIPAERLVKLRIGLVIARSGGAFPLLRLPYRLFVGGRMGHGRQGLPWIHLQDMVGLILFSLDRADVKGPLNAVAPDPVTNDAFGRALAAVMRRPHWFPVPGPLIRLLLGEMSTLVLTGQCAMPRKALDLGYEFVYPRLEDALPDLVR